MQLQHHMPKFNSILNFECWTLVRLCFTLPPHNPLPHVHIQHINAHTHIHLYSTPMPPWDDSDTFPDGPQDFSSQTLASAADSSATAYPSGYDPYADQQANCWQILHSDSESVIIPLLSHPTSSAHVSTSHWQYLTPTASFSTPPPPIIGLEPQPITDGDPDIVPPPVASPGGPGLIEDTEVTKGC